MYWTASAEVGERIARERLATAKRLLYNSLVLRLSAQTRGQDPAGSIGK
jgi:hypothetical protein